jgi:hypothetical protein
LNTWAFWACVVRNVVTRKICSREGWDWTNPRGSSYREPESSYSIRRLKPVPSALKTYERRHSLSFNKSLFGECDIEEMSEADAGLLQLLPHNGGVCIKIFRPDRYRFVRRAAGSFVHFAIINLD